MYYVVCDLNLDMIEINSNMTKFNPLDPSQHSQRHTISYILPLFRQRRMHGFKRTSSMARVPYLRMRPGTRAHRKTSAFQCRTTRSRTGFNLFHIILSIFFIIIYPIGKKETRK